MDWGGGGLRFGGVHAVFWTGLEFARGGTAQEYFRFPVWHNHMGKGRLESSAVDIGRGDHSCVVCVPPKRAWLQYYASFSCEWLGPWRWLD